MEEEGSSIEQRLHVEKNVVQAMKVQVLLAGVSGIATQVQQVGPQQFIARFSMLDEASCIRWVRRRRFAQDGSELKTTRRSAHNLFTTR